MHQEQKIQVLSKHALLEARVCLSPIYPLNNFAPASGGAALGKALRLT